MENKLKNNGTVESFGESEDIIYDIKDIQKKKKNLINKKKVSISAEAFGEYNKLSDFKPRLIKKEENVKLKILKTMNKAFMFSNLDDKEKIIVVNAMEVKHFKSNEYVIKQGEDGDILYLVEDGQLDCYKKFNKNDTQDTFLKSYYTGECFGELALLYNVPRAASIKTKTNSILYALDRSSFNNIVKMSAIKKREMFEKILNNVEILKTLDKGEIIKLCDCLKIKSYTKNDFIIKEGEDGHSFFIIKKGKLKAIKTIDNMDKVVFEYDNNGYFGELSLLKQSPRAASIIVTSENAEIIEIDKFAFDNLLGTLDSLLKRNIEMYEKFKIKNFSKNE